VEGGGRKTGRMAASQLLQKLKQLDAYPKINEDFYSRTLSGGLITIVAAIFMVLLFFTELRRFPSFSWFL